MSIKTSTEHLLDHAKEVLARLNSAAAKGNIEATVQDLEAAIAEGAKAMAKFAEGGLDNDLAAAKDGITAVEKLAQAIKSAYAVIETL